MAPPAKPLAIGGSKHSAAGQGGRPGAPGGERQSERTVDGVPLDLPVSVVLCMTFLPVSGGMGMNDRGDLRICSRPVASFLIGKLLRGWRWKRDRDGKVHLEVLVEQPQLHGMAPQRVRRKGWQLATGALDDV